jgi:hypothetical protein
MARASRLTRRLGVPDAVREFAVSPWYRARVNLGALHKAFAVRHLAWRVLLAIIVLRILDTFVGKEISVADKFIRSYGPGFPLTNRAIFGVVLVISIYFFVRNQYTRLLFLFLLGNVFMTYTLISDVVLIIANLPDQTEGYTILTDAVLVWILNIFVFSFWYYFVDCGGPAAREIRKSVKMDLVFPQEQQTFLGWEDWTPSYVDYLFLSFFSSMAFTPTDTLVLSTRMKPLLMIQACISLIVLAAIAARAINVIG